MKPSASCAMVILPYGARIDLNGCARGMPSSVARSSLRVGPPCSARALGWTRQAAHQLVEIGRPHRFSTTDNDQFLRNDPRVGVVQHLSAEPVSAVLVR